jgi:hypothetical protein
MTGLSDRFFNSAGGALPDRNPAGLTQFVLRRLLVLGVSFSLNVVVDNQIENLFCVGEDFEASGMNIHFQLFSVLFDVLEIRASRIDKGFAYHLCQSARTKFSHNFLQRVLPWLKFALYNMVTGMSQFVEKDTFLICGQGDFLPPR